MFANVFTSRLHSFRQLPIIAIHFNKINTFLKIFFRKCEEKKGRGANFHLSPLRVLSTVLQGDATRSAGCCIRQACQEGIFLGKISLWAKCLRAKKWEVGHLLSKKLMLTDLHNGACGKQLWKSLWIMWKSGSFQQLYTRFREARALPFRCISGCIFLIIYGFF